MKLRIASLPILCLALAVVPALAQPPQFWYDNGPINGNVNGFPISFGSMVSDSFFLPEGFHGVAWFTFGVWESPGDVVSSVQWSVTDYRGVVYGQGTASGANLSDTFLFRNGYGYSVDQIWAWVYAVPLPAQPYYSLKLWNATTRSGNPVYWDENSGIGCMSYGCPSTASGYFPDFEGPETSVTVGTIPSEAFTIDFFSCADRKGSNGGCALEPSGAPEPGSIILFGSGMIGLVGVLRRKLSL
jgi:PEP-CTERM motif